MESFRAAPPRELAGEEVLELRDYQERKRTVFPSEKTEDIALPSSNVIQFVTSAGSIVTARPSGTEPKIKFYFSVCMSPEELAKKNDYGQAKKELESRIVRLKAALGING